RAGAGRTLRGRAALHPLVRGGGPPRRPCRDRLPRVRADARGGARPAAGTHTARREGTPRRLRRSRGNGDAGTGEGVTGVVLARTGSTYRVHAERGEITAVLRGKVEPRERAPAGPESPDRR